MPTFNLNHDNQGSGTGKVNCGTITVSQANNQTTVMANPPGGGAPTNITSLAVFTAAPGSNGTLLNPNPGDMLNLTTYTVTLTFTFSTNATFRAPGGGKPGGFFTSGGSITGAVNDWDAADAGGPEPKGGD
jgi:hypothetical protein